VQISGGGDGFGGAEAEPGLPGPPTEQTESVSPKTDVAELAPVNDSNLKDVVKSDLPIPDIDFSDRKTDVEDVLANLKKQADEQAKKENPTTKKPAKIAGTGAANPQGVGQGGSGGLGKGTKGTTGRPGGRKATKAEIYAWRWKFSLGRNAKEHVDQLRAIGFTVVLEAPDGRVFFVKNLSRVPIEIVPGDLRKFEDAAKWKNEKVESLVAFAQETKLSFIPARVVMCLPLDRQEQIADEEMRFSKVHRNDLQNVRETHFVFQLRDGAYVPEATAQLNLDGRLVTK
jgi:hypothetical protein